MKIVTLTQNFPPRKITGAEKFSFEISYRLKKKHEIVILTNESGVYNGLKKEAIIIEKNKLKRKLFYDYFNNNAFKSINKLIDNIKPSIIHINNFYGIGSHSIKKIANKHPTIITVHDYFPICYSSTLSKEHAKNKEPCICYPPLGKIHKEIMFNHLKNITLVSPSKFLANKLINAGFKKVETIHNGVYYPKDRTIYKKKILFVGRLTMEKGVQTVISTLNSITDYEVIILGDGPLKKELQEKYKNVKFVGFRNPEKFYKDASISIVPSIWEEPFGLSVTEAMSYGLCVVASNIGGIPEQISNMHTGLLFKPGNEKDFKMKMDYLINNPKEIKRMGMNARKFVKKNFTWNKVVKKYEKIYKKVIGEHKYEK